MRRVMTGLTVILTLVACTAMAAIGTPQPQVTMAPGDITLTCPHVASPTDGQQVTCTYRVETAPPTTTITTTATTPPTSPPFPSAGNTGVPAGTSLTFVPGDDYNPPANTVRDGIETNALNITQANITIKNSYIRDSINIEGSGSLTLENVTIGPVCNPSNRVDTWFAEAIRGSNYTATRIKVQGHEDGPRVGGTNVTIKDSFIDICGHPEGHSDGMQDYPQANGIVLEHNTIDLRGEQGQNASINVNAGDQGPTCLSDNVMIKNNLVMGGGYTMTLCPTNTSWIVMGNRVVPGTGGVGDWFGPWNVAHGCKGVWSDNDIVTINTNYEVTGTIENDRSC